MKSEKSVTHPSGDADRHKDIMNTELRRKVWATDINLEVVSI